jgi:hypothetical protein
MTIAYFVVARTKGNKVAKVSVCKFCGELTADDHEIKQACYYWFRQTKDSVWRIVYIGGDSSGARLWFHQIDTDPIDISQMDLSQFNFIEIKPPPEGGKQK